MKTIYMVPMNSYRKYNIILGKLKDIINIRKTKTYKQCLYKLFSIELYCSIKFIIKIGQSRRHEPTEKGISVC